MDKKHGKQNLKQNAMKKNCSCPSIHTYMLSDKKTNLVAIGRTTCPPEQVIRLWNSSSRDLDDASAVNAEADASADIKSKSSL